MSNIVMWMCNCVSVNITKLDWHQRSFYKHIFHCVHIVNGELLDMAYLFVAIHLLYDSKPNTELR